MALWPVLSFALGFVFGPGMIWQWADLRLRSEARADDRIKIEREFYERLQILANDALSQFPVFVNLRDSFLASTATPEQVDELLSLEPKLVSLVRKYNASRSETFKNGESPTKMVCDACGASACAPRHKNRHIRWRTPSSCRGAYACP